MFGPLSHIWRLGRAGLVLARYDIELPPALARRIPWPVRVLSGAARLLPAPKALQNWPADRAGRLSAALAALGPAWVKLGQFLATRPDVLGPHLSEDLAALQDKLPPFPMEEARATLAAEFGRPAESLFAAFSAPIAAASIAQVHRARLAGTNGGEVAVKIMRPGIRQRFARDLAAFEFAARLAERLLPATRRLEPVKLVETPKESVRLELDFRFEAAGASEMAELTAADPQFQTAAIDWSRTGKTVLTSAWVDGIPIADHTTLKTAGFDLDEVGTVLMQSFLTHALRDGVFHADMHPGNLFVTRTLEGGPPVLVAVDFGIIGRLDRRMRRFMAETLLGFLTRDYRRIANVHFEVGFVGAEKSIDAFAQALRSVGEPLFGQTSENISMAKLLSQLFEVTRLFDMHLQPQLVMLQKTMVVVEGVARSLSPQINLWEVARPVVETWMRRELGAEARIADAAETALSFARAARRAPEVLEKMEHAADRLNLSAAGASAETPAKPQPKPALTEARLALWISAAALAALALSAF